MCSSRGLQKRACFLVFFQHLEVLHSLVHGLDLALFKLQFQYAIFSSYHFFFIKTCDKHQGNISLGGFLESQVIQQGQKYSECGGCHPLGWCPGMNRKEKASGTLTLTPLFPDYGSKWSSSSCFCCHVTMAMMDYTLYGKTKISSPLSHFCQEFFPSNK